MNSYILRDIAARFGGDCHGSYVLVPGPGHSRRDRSLKVWGHQGRIFVHSYCGDNWQDCRRYLGIDEDRRWTTPPPPRPCRSPEPPPAVLSSFGADLWADCRTITPDTVAGRYLAARGCALPHPDGDLRWHSELRHPTGYVGAALVGLVTDAGDAARRMTLHRTWITSNGTKADVTPPRLLLKGCPKAGGVIRLWPDDLVTYGLGLAEGAETALALARAFRPVWATIDAGNLKAFPLLDGIEALTVAVDHDDAGRKAFESVAARWRAAGREVRGIMAPTPKTDLADLMREVG